MIYISGMTAGATCFSDPQEWRQAFGLGVMAMITFFVLWHIAMKAVDWLAARRAYNNRIYADDEPHFIEPVSQWCPRGDG